MDWRTPIGGTRDLLALVPGLTDKAFRKRKIALGVAVAIGTGHAAQWTAEDVLEAATIQELARLGVLLGEAYRIWLMVRERMMERGGGDRSRGGSVILWVDPPSGELISRMFHDGSDPGRDPRDGLSTFVTLRVDHLIDRVAASISAAESVS